MNYTDTCTTLGCQLILRERTLSMKEGGGGFYKFFKKNFVAQEDHRPKYFMAQ